MGAFDLRLDFERRRQPTERGEVRRELGGAELLLWITFRNGYPEVAGGSAAGKITGPTIAGTPVYVSNQFGRAFRTSSTTYIYWDDPDHVLDQGATKWAVAFTGTLGQSAANRCIVNLADPALLTTGFVIKQREFGSNNNTYSHFGPNLTRGVFGMRPFDAFSTDFWANGVITRGVVSGIPTTPTNTRIILGRQANLTTDVGADADINDVFLFKDQPGIAAWSELMASPYTTMFGVESLGVWVPLTAGGIDLAGAAQGTATTTGELSQSTPLSGVASVNADTAGTLSKAVPMTAVALSVSAAGGNVSVSINPTGAAQGQSDASGSLTVTGNNSLAGNATVTPNVSGDLSLVVTFNGAAIAQALSQVTMSVDKSLSGGGGAEASVLGQITLNVSLAGYPIADASAAAALTVNSTGFSGAAAANASSLGNLSLSIPLSGASLVASGAPGSITKIVSLAGIAASASLITGGLDVSVQIAAAAVVEALAFAGLTREASVSGAARGEAGSIGVLTLRVNLDSTSVAQAVASGALATAGQIVSGTPGYRVGHAPRTWRVRRPERTWRVSAA